MTYAWGLRLKTNNEEEWLTLFFGLYLVNQNNITKFIVMGDSKQIIHKMTSGYNQGAIKIRRIYEGVRKISANMQISFYQILRSNNTEVGNLENQGDKLKIVLSMVKVQLKNLMYVP